MQALKGVAQGRGIEQVVDTGIQTDGGQGIIRVALAALQDGFPGEPTQQQPGQGEKVRQQQEQLAQGLEPGAMLRIERRSLQWSARRDGLGLQAGRLWRRRLTRRRRPRSNRLNRPNRLLAPRLFGQAVPVEGGDDDREQRCETYQPSAQTRERGGSGS